MMEYTPWVRAFIDERFGPEGDTSSIGKCRIELPDGTLVCDFEGPDYALIQLASFKLL